MRYASLLALVTALGACNRPAKPAPEAPSNLPPAASAPVTEAVAPDADSVAPAEAKATVAEANNAFAFDLYAKIRGQSGNFTFSPASIMAALAMTQGGARGETREQMAKVLHLDPSQAEASFEMGKALRALTEKSSGTTLRMANRLFGERAFTFEEAFLTKTKAAFGAPLEPLDFRKDAEGARATINAWVAKETARKIEDLVPPGGIAPDTRLVLANAIYFLGKWQSPFEKSATSPAPFFLANGTTKQVPTMHQTGARLYAETEGAKLLELGYRDSDVVMTFVLPDAKDGLAKLEAKLSPELLSKWVGALERHRTEISLPKFRIEAKDALALGKHLADLGMKLAFDPAKADFTAMANPPNANDRLSIGDVFHKAFVAVDEEGTEAAAATAVVMRTAGMMMPEEVKEFRADRPFLFFLRHQPTGLVLFAGRVAEP